jgi:hypothetical protein
MFQSGYNADDKIQVHKWSIRASEAISKIQCVMAISSMDNLSKQPNAGFPNKKENFCQCYFTA